MEFICIYCNKLFPTQSRLDIHYKSKLPCFIKKLNIKNFYEFYSEEEKKEYSQKELKKGYYNHNNIFVCIFCTKTYENQSLAVRHIKSFCDVLKNR